MPIIDKEKMLASKDISLVDAMKKIDENNNGILYIVDGENYLLGSLTDGDIRRYIIRTGKIDGSASEIMNPEPKFVWENEKKKADAIFRKYGIDSIPVVDGEKKLKEILYSHRDEKNTIDKDALKGTPIIIMAGGKGTRLYPYTKILPKPLIPIGDVPILERIIDRFVLFGADEFYITVNYKKGMIKSYFNDLEPSYKIHFIDEDEPLGTAGSITLIKEEFEKPVIVTNCDILIEADFGKLLKHHLDSKNAMTIVSSMKNIEIPYGVLYTKEEGEITSMEEKPMISRLVNTGMYVVNPEELKKIPKNTVYHMPTLAEELIQENEKVGTFPISENAFLDMGQFAEMKKMEERIATESGDNS